MLTEISTPSLKNLTIFSGGRGNQEDTNWLTKLGSPKLEDLAIYNRNVIKRKAIQEVMRRKRPETECKFRNDW